MNKELLIKNFELTGKELGFSKGTITNYTNKFIDQSVKNLAPSVIEESSNGNLISYDVYSRLLKDRVIFLGHPIMDEVTNIVIAQLLFLEMTDEKKDITIYLNSPGGSVVAGLSLVNTMEYINPDVSVVAIGMAASMGAVILSCGEKGKRYALQDTRVMIHQPSTQISGKSSDIEVSYEELLKTKKRLYEILSERSGQTYDQILKKSEKDYWMTAEEAAKEGFIDKVLIKRNKK
jgi:ATP-dependent Clp protease protease subunit